VHTTGVTVGRDKHCDDFSCRRNDLLNIHQGDSIDLGCHPTCKAWSAALDAERPSCGTGGGSSRESARGSISVFQFSRHVVEQNAYAGGHVAHDL
jgi:hypothetical protein